MVELCNRCNKNHIEKYGVCVQCNIEIEYYIGGEREKERKAVEAMGRH